MNSIIDVTIKAQNQDICKLRNQLKENLSAADYTAILDENDQFIPTDSTKVCQM